jgi:hypothetical protein
MVPSGQYVYGRHSFFEALQLPSSHLIGKFVGHITIVGQLVMFKAQEPSGHWTLDE